MTLKADGGVADDSVLSHDEEGGDGRQSGCLGGFPGVPVVERRDRDAQGLVETRGRLRIVLRDGQDREASSLPDLPDAVEVRPGERARRAGRLEERIENLAGRDPGRPASLVPESDRGER